MKKNVLTAFGLLALFSILNAGDYEIFRCSHEYDSVKVIEKVYLHTDRDFYSQGDDLWFKAYLIDATDGILTGHSNNLHIELISPESKIVESRTIRIDSGLGYGDFIIEKELNPGSYTIRAYTNYMRNFNDSFYYTKNIFVAGAIENDKWPSDSALSEKDDTDIGFYPEGGSMINGAESEVAFKAINSFGSGPDVEGVVYSSDGDSITSFRSVHKGMGKFSFTPQAGIHYFAVIRKRGDPVNRYNLPESGPFGVVLCVTGQVKNELRLAVRTNTGTLRLIRDKDLTMSVSARGIVFKEVRFRLRSLNNYYNLKTEDLPDGIINLRLSELNDLPLCERLVFIHNKPDPALTVTTDKPEYGQRDSVTAKLLLGESIDKGSSAYLSFSAADEASIAGKSAASDISSWFLLESDIRGPVEEPSYYFDKSNPGRLDNLDLLLMTQGWRDFSRKYDKIMFPAEKGFAFSGKVRKLFADEPLTGARVTGAIFAGETPSILTAPTDNSGLFRFDGLDFSGKATIIASASGKNGKFQGWLIPDTNKYSPAEIRTTPLRPVNGSKKDVGGLSRPPEINQSISGSIEIYRKFTEIKNSVLRKYKLSDTITPGEVTIIVRRDEFPESVEIRSRQYLRTSDLDESLAITPEMEAIPVNQIISNRFAYSEQISGPPLILLDGMRVGGEGLQGLSGGMVARIDFISGMHAGVFGEAGINGVISVITSDNWADKSKPSYSSAKVYLTGYDEPRVFYSPKHYRKLESDYNPDIRTTLFWEPNIVLRGMNKADLKFFNTDRSGTVRISVEGITSEGIPVTGSTEYTIK